MMTKEELNTLKEEVETLNKKLKNLTDEELEQVAGGTEWGEGNLKLNEEFMRAFLEALFQAYQTGSGDPEHFKEMAENRIENFYLTRKQKARLREVVWNYYQALKQ